MSDNAIAHPTYDVSVLRVAIINQRPDTYFTIINQRPDTYFMIPLFADTSIFFLYFFPYP